MAFSTTGLATLVADTITARDAVDLNTLTRAQCFEQGMQAGFLNGIPLSEVTLATLVTLLGTSETKLSEAVALVDEFNSATATDAANDTARTAANTADEAAETAAQAAIDAFD